MGIMNLSPWGGIQKFLTQGIGEKKKSGAERIEERDLRSLHRKVLNTPGERDFKLSYGQRGG